MSEVDVRWAERSTTMMTLAEIQLMARERQYDLRDEQQNAARARQAERRTPSTVARGALAAGLSLFTALRSLV
jgi:hypothetical protein